MTVEQIQRQAAITEILWILWVVFAVLPTVLVLAHFVIKYW